MARPYKQTVDYFPHDTDASDGKTLTIIQAKYGNDGYAFWFKLLQLLGRSPGHYYDFNKPADWEFLLAKTHQNDTEKAKAILDTLALLDAIDPELYAHGFIWCQKFVDGVADAYNRTEKGPPQRPGFLVNVENKGVSVEEPEVSANNNSKKPTKTPQTKLKETKLNNTILPDFIDKEIWEDFLEMRKKARKPPTDKAVKLLLEDLEKYRVAGDDPNEVLKQSIKNNWAGVFPLKGGSHGANRQGSTKLPPRDEYTKPRRNPKLDKLVEQQRAADSGSGRDEPR